MGGSSLVSRRRGRAGGDGAPDLETSPADPDEEIAVATLDPERAVYVERQGRLIAAVEVISPRNKDRPFARTAYLARYLGYLLDGAILVLIDVHRRPMAFSFADQNDPERFLRHGDFSFVTVHFSSGGSPGARHLHRPPVGDPLDDGQVSRAEAEGVEGEVDVELHGDEVARVVAEKSKLGPRRVADGLRQVGRHPADALGEEFGADVKLRVARFPGRGPAADDQPGRHAAGAKRGREQAGKAAAVRLARGTDHGGRMVGVGNS